MKITSKKRLFYIKYNLSGTYHFTAEKWNNVKDTKNKFQLTRKPHSDEFSDINEICIPCWGLIYLILARQIITLSPTHFIIPELNTVTENIANKRKT